MRRIKSTSVIRIFMAVCLLFAAVGGAGVAIAEEENETVEDEAPMYDDHGGEADTEGWLADRGEPTLENVTAMVSRIGTFVIGGSPDDAGDDSDTGPLLVGVLLVGVISGGAARSGVGSVGGGVLLVVGAFAASSVGIAPQWSEAVVMFGIGLLLSLVGKRLMS